MTAVELLPVQAFADEPFLVQPRPDEPLGVQHPRLLRAPRRLRAASTAQGVVDEFKGMVKLLHRAGIEVILDVVYNHTCEQGGDGPTLSWRGLDDRAYYRLDERGRDIDVTGCGNTLDLRHPVVARMVLDSLRYWVTECHVDGFRFDLAVALARGRADDYDPDHPFLIALRTDPVLSRVRLVAEPWDVGIHGWRTGQFPPPFSEWNDRFRDAARTFWVTDLGALSQGGHGHGLEDLAMRLSGSQDLFGARERGVIASVNFVTAHDGFTLADLTAFDGKHNLANLEDNRDGSEHNRSWNHGVEGPDRRPVGARVPAADDAQPARDDDPRGRRPDAQRRRRVRAHPARQQQRLLPGRPDQLVRLGPRAVAGGAARRDPRADPHSPRPSRPPAAAVLHRRAQPQRRVGRPVLVGRRTASRWAPAGRTILCAPSRCTSTGDGSRPTRSSSPSTAASSRASSCSRSRRGTARGSCSGTARGTGASANAGTLVSGEQRLEGASVRVYRSATGQPDPPGALGR